MKLLTQAQRERQNHRERGKYSKMNICEICGKSCGANYYSASDCNKTGVNVTLCKKCAIKYEELKEVR
jgi:hypothetical protein